MSASENWVWLFVALVRLKQLRSYGRRGVRKLTGRRHDGFAGSLPRQVPKNIWLYWDSGEATAPPIVAACIASWRDRNPDWTVHVLDAENVASMVDMPLGPKDISVQAFADLLRLRLLRQQGGVWADATVLCLRPLDDWLPPLARHGFFAFIWDKTDRWFILPNVLRETTNWFMASEAEGEVVTQWEARSFTYWQGRKAAHVYYWPHVMFEYLVLTSRQFRENWRKMPKLGAFGPHLVHDYVLSGRDPDQIRAALDSGVAPIQKLRWNWSAPELERARQVLPELSAPAPVTQAD